MNRIFRTILIVILAVPLLIIISFEVASLLPNSFLSFSDAAKFADIARNLANGHGYGSLFNFFGPNLFGQLNLFPAQNVTPLPLSLILYFSKYLG